ncbi:MAG TPA: DUF664 domain-containing protein [Streptosporangiaceae bacterium]|jgi:hypothetical protein
MGISLDDLAYFVDCAIDDMIGIVRDLGGELAGTRPELPGANSPYAILTHCLGVMDYWGGHAVAGREVVRDRAAEFRAAGAADRLAEACEQAKRQFAADLAVAQPDQPLRRPASASTRHRGAITSQGQALLHVLEEVAQHHGQAELTRDLLQSGTGGNATPA